MNKTMHVAVIGESVLVEGIAVGLEDDPFLTVLRLPERADNILQLLIDFRPDVVIFPLGCPELETTLSQLRNDHGVRFVGLDIDCNQALVVDSKLHFSLSMESLQQLIVEEGGDNRGATGWQEQSLPPQDAPAVDSQLEA